MLGTGEGMFYAAAVSGKERYIICVKWHLFSDLWITNTALVQGVT